MSSGSRVSTPVSSSKPQRSHLQKVVVVLRIASLDVVLRWWQGNNATTQRRSFQTRSQALTLDSGFVERIHRASLW
ncbi:hypothetical protein KCU72_g2, partial [Aureobasidium melanogenum]